MWTCFRWNRLCYGWLVMISRALGFALIFAMVGCAVLPGGVGENEPRNQLRASLENEPVACADYRATYVEGFELHVQGISTGQESLKRKGLEQLENSRSLLAANNLEAEKCSRPHCIIKPRDGGRLISWCGYRVERSNGEALFQWFEWSKVEKDR